MKCYLNRDDFDAVAIDLPDDPFEAANLVLHLMDEWNGNDLGYPHLITEEEHEEKA